MEKTLYHIKTITMDLETLKNNLKYAQSFNDEQYEKKLKSLLTKPLLVEYTDVIEYLIDNKICLEQECFYNI